MLKQIQRMSHTALFADSLTSLTNAAYRAQNAFICHLENHWFTIRKIGGYWWNFDSLQNEPSYVGDFYLRYALH